MRTFAQKQNQPQERISSSLARSNTATSGGINHTILHLLRTIGNQAVQQLLQANAEELEVGSTSAEAPRFAHDFSQIALHSPAALATQTKLAINKPGDKYKQLVDVREEMRSDPISSPVAPGLQFDFARIPVTATPIQRKPTVNSPGDPFEREADDVAEKVMRMVEATPIGSAPAAIQRKCAGCEDEEERSIQTKPAPSVVAQPPAQGVTTRPVALQGIEGRDNEDTLFRQSVIFRKAELAVPHTTAAPVSPITDRLVGRQAKGEPLPAMIRQRMENAFGYDFSRVRVHRDGEAGEISQQLSALAFTHGSHIYFGKGMYDPAGSSGNRLLAHELTHVVQQGQAAPQRSAEAATPAAAVRTSAPTIQRFSYFEGKVVHQVNNLAETALFGKDVGTTVALLNGQITTTAQDPSTHQRRAGPRTRSALKRPTLSFTPAAAGGFDARVRTVPTNKGSVDETVLAARRWTLNVPKATVLAHFPDLTTCRGAGRTIFQALGMPSDPAMFAASRRHEDHHADAFVSAFMGTIWPWDTALDVAAGSATPYHGAIKADAEAALYAAMGGTPDQIADKLVDAVAAAIEAYHNTPEGGPVSWDSETAKADANCATSSVECTNPS